MVRAMSHEAQQRVRARGAGAWEIEARLEDSKWFVFTCPGCGAVSEVEIIPPGRPASASHQWDWDGNLEAPTLSPSLQELGGCRWHGYMRGGSWVLA